MRTWFRRVRAALFMGVAWALVWGLGAGGAIELLLNLGLGTDWMRRVDMWPQTFAIPGFLTGAVFSMVLGTAARGRRFEELNVGRFAAWGAAGGLVGGALLIAMWNITGPVGVPIFLGVPATLGALSASATLAVARLAERRQAVGAGSAEDGARLGDGESR